GFLHHEHHFNKELSDSVPFNVEQQSCVKKYKYSDYGCQVEVPSSVSFMNCHHNHHYTHVLNKVESDTMHIDSISSSATSLLLIASQLAEVKQETNSLRSRKKDLSFRLSNLLALDHRDSQSKLGIDTFKFDERFHSDKEDSQVNEDSRHDGDTVTVEKASTNEEQENIIKIKEATATLYARLTAVEMLLKNAESTEAQLEKEFGHLMTNHNGTKPSSSSLSPSTRIIGTTSVLDPVTNSKEEHDHQQKLEQLSVIKTSLNSINENVCSHCKIPRTSSNGLTGGSRKRNGRNRRHGYKASTTNQQNNSGRGRYRTRRRELIDANFSEQSDWGVTESENDCSSLTVSLAS
ncbi:unnamed protein product, partial [Trichobilharzia regenti]